MNLAARIPLAFHSPKADHPIPYVGAAACDHLIQASLDFSVTSISYIDLLPAEERIVRIAAPLMATDHGAYVALLDGAHPDREADPSLLRAAIAAAGLATRRIRPEDVASEPIATTARVIWRQRHVGVDPGMRIGLEAAFADQTSMTVRELCERVSGPRDPVFALMALACEARLHLDLSRGFNGDTTVRGPR